MPARRPESTISPATALMTSLRQAWVAKSPASSTPSISAAIAWAAGSSGNVSRTSPRTRTCPGPMPSTGTHTMAGRTVAPPTCGPTSSRCSTPFWSTATTVSSRVSARRNGAAASVWCALTATSTTSTGVAAFGSVSTGPGTISVPPPSRSTTSRSCGVRPHSTRSAPARRTAAATVAPMAPGPTTATRVTQRRSRPRRPGPAGRAARRGGPRPARRSCSRRRSAGSAGRRACPSPARTRRRPDSARRGPAAR